MAIGPLVEPIDECTPTEQFIGWTLERFRNRRVVVFVSPRRARVFLEPG